MKGILFVPDSGNQYREFQRESVHAARFFDARVVFFPGTAPQLSKRLVLTELAKEAGAGLEIVGFLCHGFRVRIQAGFDRSSADELAKAIAAACVPTASVPLYCCSTGNGPGVDRDGVGEATGPGEGGFADTLRDELVANGMRGGKLFTHTTAGHLARNPDARVYAIEPGVVSGDDIAPRAKDRDLYRRWRGLLHTPTGRWEVATLGRAEIEAMAAKCEPYVAPKKL